MRQGADQLARAQAVFYDVDTVDGRVTLVWLQYSVKDAHGCGFARTVRAEQARNLAVGRLETNATDSVHFTEGLVNIVDFNHGAGPEKSRKKGVTKLRSMQSVSSVEGSADSTKFANTRPMQPTEI